jgi:tRNA(Ile)-lysidine synthase
MGNRSGAIALRRKGFSALPTVLRVRILQRICFDRLGLAPNERLLKSMDCHIRDGGPSARVKVGKGWGLVNRYEEAIFLHENEHETPAGPEGGGTSIIWNAKGRITPAQAKRLAANGDAEVFDAAALRLPLTVRPLRAGDRIRPFGGSGGGNARDGEKKVKEILIDRKIPRDDRWGRPVVCDSDGEILWIPGVLRSAHAPVTSQTRKTAILRVPATKWTSTDRVLK